MMVSSLEKKQKGARRAPLQSRFYPFFDTHRHTKDTFLRRTKFFTPALQSHANLLSSLRSRGVFAHQAVHWVTVRLGLAHMRVEEFQRLSAQAVLFRQRLYQPLHRVLAAALSAD